MTVTAYTRSPPPASTVDPITAGARPATTAGEERLPHRERLRLLLQSKVFIVGSSDRALSG